MNCPKCRFLGRLIFICALSLSSTAFAQTTAPNGPAPSETETTPAPSETEPTPFDVFAAPLDLSPPGDQGESVGLAHGETLLRLGKLNEAALVFRRLILTAPDDAAAHERLRQTFATARRTERMTDVLVRLTDIYLGAGNRTAAERRVDELIVLAPEHSERRRFEVALGRIAANGAAEDDDTLARFRGLFGMVVLLGIAFLLSNNRRRINWRLVAWGMGLQLVFALLILQTRLGHGLFEGARAAINQVLSYTDDGARFLFGQLYNGIVPVQGQGPVMYTDGASGDVLQLGYVFAFHILPTIIFFGALMSVLYHLGIVQFIVRGIAWLMMRTMGTSGAESLSAAGNIFVGQTEAPLLVKPYVGGMTMSELMAVMVGGFATVAGGVLAAYARFGIDAGHLLAASVMSAPAALVVAKILYPETEISKTRAGSTAGFERTTENVIDAAAAGAGDGLRLAVNVGAMLLAFIALIALLNGILGWLGGVMGFDGLSLSRIFGWVFYPLSWCMGVDSKDLLEFGRLLGAKIAINEFYAYVELGHLRHQLSERSFVIGTYALCGFANFASIGIQIGGISGIAPERRSDLARIGLKAMLGGAIASWLTASIAGVLI